MDKPMGIKDIEQVAMESIDKWIDKMGPGGIEKYIFKMLGRKVESIIAGMLGFETGSFGREKWTVDHCNGRHSELSVWLKQRAEVAVAEWFKDLDRSMFPAISQEVIDELSKDFNRQVHYAAQTKLRDRAEQRALELIEKIVNNDVVDKPKI